LGVATGGRAAAVPPVIASLSQFDLDYLKSLASIIFGQVHPFFRPSYLPRFDFACTRFAIRETESCLSFCEKDSNACRMPMHYGLFMRPILDLQDADPVILESYPSECQLPSGFQVCLLSLACVIGT
jgi:hypothetical protein